MDDSTKSIRGTNYAPQTRGPRQMGRREVAGSHTQVIGESQYHDGQPRHGINPANVSGGARKLHYTHPEAVAHRRGLTSQPYPGKR